MSANLKLLSSFKLLGHLNNNFACGLSQDDRIFIISDLGLYIITQKPNLSSIHPEFMCHKYILKPSSFAVCENVDIDINSFFYELPKDVIFESTASVELTQNLKGTTPSQPSIVCAQWSDTDMVDKVGSMLALLTNLYSLEIYIKSVSESNLIEYKIILNLTNEIINKRKADFVYCVKMPALQKFKELRKRVEYIGPTTFQWSHTFTYEGRNCAVIFVGHFHGDISVWRIFSVDSDCKNAQCDFLCRYSSKMGNISALYWHRTTVFSGGLCVGDSSGKISILQISNLEKEICTINNETEFFTESDRRVDKITVVTFGNYTILIAIKQSYLLIFGLDLMGQVFDFTVHDVHNFYITGISHKANIVKVLTFTGIFKELRLSVHFNKIVIEEITVPMKIDILFYRTHGFIESNNSILYALILSPSRLKNSVRGKKFVNFHLYNDANRNPLKLLLENSTNSLRTFWDCFEALRLICLKEQRFPWLGISSNLELDNLSLIQLKTYRLIAKLSETVFAVIKRVTSYEIKPYILLHYLVDIKLISQRLGQLFKDRDALNELSAFELKSIDVQVFFLKELVVSGILPKAQVGSKFINEISSILTIANEIKYPDMDHCKFCGEKIIGSMCLPPHADSRCAYTMMPIFLAPAYKCILCNSLAHSEVAKELNPLFCPYCDYPMERICVNEKIKEQMNNFDSNENQIKSNCLPDCLQDTKETLEELEIDLEDNDLVLVNISDDEEMAGESELAELYFKLTSLKVEDDADVNRET